MTLRDIRENEEYSGSNGKFPLVVGSSTNETNRKSADHAQSVLGNGQVTVTLGDGENVIAVQRGGSDEASKHSQSFDLPIIYSQTEMENFGLDPSVRIGLVDAFRSEAETFDLEEGNAIAKVLSLAAGR